MKEYSLRVDQVTAVIFFEAFGFEGLFTGIFSFLRVILGALIGGGGLNFAGGSGCILNTIIAPASTPSPI